MRLFATAHPHVNVSTDLMLGIPHQTLDSFAKSLQQTLAFDFGHLSVYMLQLEPKTPFIGKYKEDTSPLPPVDDLAAMYELV